MLHDGWYAPLVATEATEFSGIVNVCEALSVGGSLMSMTVTFNSERTPVLVNHQNKYNINHYNIGSLMSMDGNLYRLVFLPISAPI